MSPSDTFTAQKQALTGLNLRLCDEKMFHFDTPYEIYQVFIDFLLKDHLKHPLILSMTAQNPEYCVQIMFKHRCIET